MIALPFDVTVKGGSPSRLPQGLPLIHWRLSKWHLSATRQTVRPFVKLFLTM